MKILQLVAENIKRIRVARITPDGAIVQITGANGSGKSSVLDSILFALGGKGSIDPEPIRKGADRGRVRIDLGELIVTRLFTAKGSTLEVQGADGTDLKSPQAVLDKLLGTLTFDPLQFLRADAKTRLGMLKEAVPLDIDVNALDRERDTIFEERTSVSRRLQQFKAEALGLPDPAHAPTALVSTTDLLEELERDSRYNADLERQTHERNDQVRRVANLEGSIISLEAQLTETRQQWEVARAALTAMPDGHVPRDVAPIRARMKGAEESNKQYHAAARARDVRAAITQVGEEHEDLTRRIADIDETKRTAMERAVFPVSGLAFGDGDVIYNGFPFSQASGAEQLRVSAALAMAANPKLRVLRIKDGSLLDKNSLAILEKLAEEKDYQVWLEVVGAGGKSAVVMEDGHVVEASE